MIQTIIEWIQGIYNSIKREYRIRDDCRLTKTDIIHSLEEQFDLADLYITDSYKKLIYRDDMKKVAERFNIMRLRQYVKEKFDCEDYTFSFKGHMTIFYSQFAFGFVFVHTPKGKHALNCFIDQNGRFTYLEPQTNQIFRTKKGYEPYLIVI